MKPIYKAVELFERFGEDFDTQMRFHLNNGWVYSGDECFVMASVEDLNEIKSKKHLTGKAWFVYVYIGNLKRALNLIPFQLEYVAFRRNNGPVKVYKMKQLLRKLEAL